SAVCTCGFAVFSPYGVVTGWFTSKGCENGEGTAPEAWSQNRRNSNAPRESRFSKPFQLARTSHALPGSTGAPVLVGTPPNDASCRHMLTRSFFVIIAAYE